MPRTDAGQTASAALAATSRALTSLRLTFGSTLELQNKGRLDDLEALSKVLRAVDGRLLQLEDPSGPILHDVKPLLGTTSRCVSFSSCRRHKLDEDLSTL